jgi:hypothetical protein
MPTRPRAIHTMKWTIAPVLCALAGVLACASVSPPVASAETCPNIEYRVGPSASLPDCRAYEQVTPVEKAGGVFFKMAMGIGPDGTPTLVTSSFTAIDGIQDDNGVEGGLYASVRTDSGWTTTPLPPPATEFETSILAGGLSTYLGGSLDGRSALWQGRRLGQPENRVDFWVTRPGGAIEDIGPVTPPDTPANEVEEITNLSGLSIDPAGESADLSHILYRTRPQIASGYHFWPFDKTVESGVEKEDLYEFVGAENTSPMLVGVDDNGELISDCGTSLGAEHILESSYMHLGGQNAMSLDGDTVFFTALACGAAPPVDELFARVDNGLPDAHTLAISQPSSADCEACDTSPAVISQAIFQGASTDGSKAFFLTEQPLLGSDTTLNLYEYDSAAPAGERIVRVSGGDVSVPDPVAEVEGVLQVSQDGSHVYFVAQFPHASSPEDAKDIVVDLPPGFVGNPQVVQKCSQILAAVAPPLGRSQCPASSQIGVARLDLLALGHDPLEGESENVVPVNNVVPDKGTAAQFEFFDAAPVKLLVNVSQDTNYAVRVTVSGIPRAAHFTSSSLTFFGEPATNHDISNESVGASPFAFLQNPVDCSAGPLQAKVSVDSWQHPGSYLPDGSPNLSDPNWKTYTTTMYPSLTGCDMLQFEPSLTVTPDTTEADEPTGVNVSLTVPQSFDQIGALATPELKDATVTLPAGMSLSPSAADGLGACSDAQIGLESIEPGSCPDASVLGTVHVDVPLLENPLGGQVFLGEPECDPCTSADAADGKMIRLYIEAAGSGVRLKKEGRVYLNPSTGQLTSKFEDNPQDPFENLELDFKGGSPRSASRAEHRTRIRERSRTGHIRTPLPQPNTYRTRIVYRGGRSRRRNLRKRSS